MEKFTVLLIDDISENIFTLKMLIEDSFNDIHIVEAYSVEESLIKLMEHNIDLILSDIQMPEVDGFEMAEYLHDIEETKHIPIIFITGIYNDSIYVKKAYNLGVIDYINKPIDDELLCAKLKVFINIFENKKEDKNIIKHKEKIISSHEKLETMLNSLDGYSPEIRKMIETHKDYKALLSEEENSIDIEKVIQKINELNH